MSVGMKPYFINILIFCMAMVASVAVGAVFIPPTTILKMFAAEFPGTLLQTDWPAAFTAIIYRIRLPHAFLIALTGAALGGSGAAYQGLFRNPLADPYLIGVASGAGLGAVASMALNLPTSQLGYYAVPAAAFLGAVTTVLLVYNLAKVGKSLPITTLILAGVAVSAFATALTSFLMLHSTHEIRRALSWLLGGSLIGGWEPVLAATPYIFAGLTLLFFCGHAINLLQFGEEQAQQLGLNVGIFKTLIICATSLATAAAVSFSGLIGFIGLIVPHVIRFICGPDYRHLIPLSAIAASSALLFSDLLARTVLAPQILPVGIITALAGAPFFLWVLRRSKQQGDW